MYYVIPGLVLRYAPQPMNVPCVVRMRARERGRERTGADAREVRPWSAAACSFVQHPERARMHPPPTAVSRGFSGKKLNP